VAALVVGLFPQGNCGRLALLLG